MDVGIRTEIRLISISERVSINLKTKRANFTKRRVRVLRKRIKRLVIRLYNTRLNLVRKSLLRVISIVGIISSFSASCTVQIVYNELQVKFCTA